MPHPGLSPQKEEGPKLIFPFYQLLQGGIKMRKVLILGILVALSIASAPIVFSQGDSDAATIENALGLSKVSKPVYDMDSYGDKPVYSMDTYGDKPVYSLGMRSAAKPVYDTSSLSGKNVVFDVTQRRGKPASFNYTMGQAKLLYNASAYYKFRPIYDISSYFRAKPLYSIGTYPSIKG
jgi:hypothetical protein